MQPPTELELYLEEVRRRLNLDPERSGPIIRELRSHLLERAEDGEESGLSREEALARSIDSLGRPKALARLLYESHHKTSWSELGVSALPHLMIAFLFAIGGWDNWVWAPLLLLPMVLVTLYGWWQGKPGWLYPWAGWSLVPMAIGAYFALPVFNQIYRLLTSSGPATRFLGRRRPVGLFGGGIMDPGLHNCKSGQAELDPGLLNAVAHARYDHLVRFTGACRRPF